MDQVLLMDPHHLQTGQNYLEILQLHQKIPEPPKVYNMIYLLQHKMTEPPQINHLIKQLLQIPSEAMSLHLLTVMPTMNCAASTHKKAWAPSSGSTTVYSPSAYDVQI